MRRLLAAAATLTLLTATGPRPEPLRAAKTCPEYCGEKAAENCEDIDSLECTWYILGCLAGCNLKKL